MKLLILGHGFLIFSYCAYKDVYAVSPVSPPRQAQLILKEVVGSESARSSNCLDASICNSQNHLLVGGSSSSTCKYLNVTDKKIRQGQRTKTG